MKKLTAGIFATILGLTAIDAYAAVPSQHYVDTAVAAAEGRAATDATTKAGNALAEAKTWVDEQAYLQAADISGKADTSYVNEELAKKQNELDATNVIVDPTKSGGNVVTKITANNGVVTYETGTVATTAGLEALQATVDGHTTSIGNLTNNKLDKDTYNTDKATFETINGAAGKYEPILDAAERAAITSGITAEKVGDIATAIETANGAKEVAENAVEVAQTAEVTANAANETAGEAKTAAANAQTTANGAVSTANAADATAKAAQKDAGDAVAAAQEAKSAVNTLTTTVEGHTTSIGALESGKLNVVPATSVTTDGQYVLTMKKSGETMTYGWELITRSEGK